MTKPNYLEKPVYFCEFKNPVFCRNEGGVMWPADGIMVYLDPFGTHTNTGVKNKHVLVPYCNKWNDLLEQNVPDFDYHNDFYASPLGKHITLEEYFEEKELERELALLEKEETEE